MQLLGSGTILREVIAAAELLKKDWKVTSDIWSVTSFSLLARDGQDAERWNLLHPADKKPRESYVAQCLKNRKGPAIAATDYMKNYAGLIRPFMPMPYATLGTDGFGRSDTRETLREFFEVDRRWIAVRALKSLAEQGVIENKVVAQAIKQYGLNPDKHNPLTV